MSLTTGLQAARDAALRDVDAVDDDVLLSRNPESTMDAIVSRHLLEPVRLGRVTIDTPRPTRMAVAGEPGQEEPGGEPLVVRGTAVELQVAVHGAATMALVAEEDDELAELGVGVDVERGRIVVRYAAERPLAQAANRQFERALRLLEARVAAANEEIAAANEALASAVRREFGEGKACAQERAKFAAGLKSPKSYERWWGRP